MPTSTVPNTAINMTALKAAFPGILNPNRMGSYRGLLPILPTIEQSISMSQLKGLTAPTPTHSLVSYEGTGISMSADGVFKIMTSPNNSGSLTLSNYISPPPIYQRDLAYYLNPSLPGFSIIKETLNVTNIIGFSTACNFTITACNSYENSYSMSFVLNAYSSPISGLSTANLKAAFTGESYSNGSWYDVTGNTAAASVVGGTIGVSTGDGTFGGRKWVSGTPGTVVDFTNIGMPGTYTLVHVIRYNGANRNRILTSSSINWLSGHHANRTGVAYHEGWLVNQDWAEGISGTTYYNGGGSVGDKWLMSTDTNSIYRVFGTPLGTGGTIPNTSFPIGINCSIFGEKSDWSCACLLVYSGNLADLTIPETWVANTYNLPRNINTTVTVAQFASGSASTTRNVADSVANCSSYAVLSTPAGFAASISGSTLSLSGDVLSTTNGTVLVRATATNGAYTFVKYNVSQVVTIATAPTYSTTIPSELYTNLTNGTTLIPLTSHFEAPESTLSFAVASVNAFVTVSGTNLQISTGYRGSYLATISAYATNPAAGSVSRSPATTVTITITELGAAVPQQPSASYNVAANGASPWGGSMTVDPSAVYIWNSSAASSSARSGDRIPFTRAYTNTGNVNIKATLYAQCDNTATAYLNGVQVSATDGISGWGGNGTGLPLVLVPGLNVLTFSALNYGPNDNPAGLQYTVINNSGGAVLFRSDTNTLTIYYPSAPSWSAIPSQTYTTGSFTLNVSSYCTNYTSLSISSSPYGNVTLSGTTLTIAAAYRNTAYSIEILATNSNGTLASTSTTSLVVTEYPPVPIWSTLPNPTYSTNGLQATNLANYCTNYTYFDQRSNPYNSAGISNTMLNVYTAMRGATYTLIIEAGNRNSSTNLISKATTSMIVTETNSIYGLPTTYLRAAYTGDSYTPVSHSPATGTWSDVSGNGRHATVSGGVSSMSSGDATFGMRKWVNGTTGTSVTFPTDLKTDGYTIFHVMKYNGPNRARILRSTTGNWLSGFWNNNTGVSFHEGWLTNSYDWAQLSSGTSYYNGGNFVGDKWLLSADSNSVYRIFGTEYSIDLGGLTDTMPYNIGVNVGGSEYSDWSIACILVYEALFSTPTHFNAIETWIASTYNLPRNKNYYLNWPYGYGIGVPTFSAGFASLSLDMSSNYENCSSYNVVSVPSGFTASVNGNILTLGVTNLLTNSDGFVVIRANSSNNAYAFIKYKVYKESADPYLTTTKIETSIGNNLVRTDYYTGFTSGLVSYAQNLFNQVNNNNYESGYIVVERWDNGVILAQGQSTQANNPNAKWGIPFLIQL